MVVGGNPYPKRGHRADLTVSFSTTVSSSKGTGSYTVKRLSDGTWRCTCPGHQWRPEQPDKHIETVRGDLLRFLLAG